jgi:hypothetical protein
LRTLGKLTSFPSVSLPEAATPETERLLATADEQPAGDVREIFAGGERNFSSDGIHRVPQFSLAGGRTPLNRKAPGATARQVGSWNLVEMDRVPGKILGGSAGGPECSLRSGVVSTAACIAARAGRSLGLAPEAAYVPPPGPRMSSPRRLKACGEIK